MQTRNLLIRLIYDFWRRSLPRYGILKKGVSVLECGTGPGNLLGLMAAWFRDANLYGLDLDYRAIGHTKQKARNAGLMVASAEYLPFTDQTFDILISLHTIEHLTAPEKFLSEAGRVLRTGGILVLATPNPEGLGARVMKFRWGSSISEHVSLKPPYKWRQLLTTSGFEVLREGTTGLSGIPIFQKLPLALINWGPLFIFGFFPWRYGEAYLCIARRHAS
jgi:ubiquinone/menaquinone biosynthesis C-methylase UbiE